LNYISYIYHNNDSIYLSAPTGFGRNNYLLYILTRELSKSKRKCLIVSPMMVILSQLNDNFYSYLNSNDIENRTKDYIEFKNGSLIEFKTSITIIGGRYSKDIDILYIDDIMETDISWNYISHIFTNYNKLIVSITTTNFVNKTKDYFNSISKGKKFIKDITINTDFVTELRSIKIEKIKQRYETKFQRIDI